MRWTGDLIKMDNTNFIKMSKIRYQAEKEILVGPNQLGSMDPQGTKEAFV